MRTAKTERTTHDLKTWPEPFQAVISGDKTFEIRQDDRGFAVGDYLLLAEWDPTTGTYTGHQVNARVDYIARDAWGLPPGLVVMAITVVGYPAR